MWSICPFQEIIKKSFHSIMVHITKFKCFSCYDKCMKILFLNGQICCFLLEAERSKFFSSYINHAMPCLIGLEIFDITKWMTMKTNRLLFWNIISISVSNQLVLYGCYYHASIKDVFKRYWMKINRHYDFQVNFVAIELSFFWLCVGVGQNNLQRK